MNLDVKNFDTELNMLFEKYNILDIYLEKNNMDIKKVNKFLKKDKIYIHKKWF